jgi:hypothetical protein
VSTLRSILKSELRIPAAKTAALASELVRRSTCFDHLSTAEQRGLTPEDVWDHLADEAGWKFVFDRNGDITGVDPEIEARAGWEVDILKCIARFVDTGWIKLEVESTRYRVRFREGECVYKILNDGEDFLGVIEED